jgi:prepilin-type N-terminal cleavage/methylation domain-containing protein
MILSPAGKPAMHSNRGLSLVEMLIVVAIVALLLSLLVTGISRIIYEGDLAKCAANQHGVATGTITYAGSHNRRYPDPPAGRRVAPYFLGGMVSESPSPYDLRPLIAEYFPVNLLTCPLSPRTSLRPEDTGDGPVFANYDYWSAWQYKPQGATAESGMFRLGDRDLVFEIDGADSPESSHPDHAETMSTLDEPELNGLFSAWVGMGARGMLDLNAAFDDGAVLRRRDVLMRDPRAKAVPLFQNDATMLGRYVPGD